MTRLFEKTAIRGMELRNRIVMPPMVTLFGNEDGTVSQRMIDYYARRAEGGAGLIEVEACTIDPQQFMVSPRQIRVSHDRFMEGLSRLARAIKAHGAKAALQLQHPGRQTASQLTGVQPVAPSALRSPIRREEAPRELSIEEISIAVENFAEGARRAKEAGFDAVEIHGAHGYLVCQFLSPFTNKRKDEYGGDVYRRARFALEIVRRTREKVGEDYPIIFRLSAEEHVEEGIVLAEARSIARLLEESGVDVLSVSAGNEVAFEWIVQPVQFRPGCLVPLAAAIKKVVKTPVMTVGRIVDPKMAERVLEQGKADLVALGRALIADPDLPRKAQDGRFSQIRRCMACRTCTTSIWDVVPIVCLMNPEMGREGEVEEKAEKRRRVLVLGGSPAGLEAARVAALRGHQVTLWEEKGDLGRRWSWLMKPHVAEQRRRLKGAGARVELGKPISPEGVSAFHPDAVIATQSASPVIPQIPGIEGKRVFLADEVLERKVKVGKKVVILGAGNIGCEAAEFLRRQGAEVTILEPSRRVAYGLEYAARKVMAEGLPRRKIKVITGAEVTGIQDTGIAFRDAEGERSLQADSVVIALGSRPDDRLRESLKDGDFHLLTVPYCEEPIRVYRAIQEGAAAARSL